MRKVLLIVFLTSPWLLPAKVMAACVGEQIDTALGCVPTEPTALVQWILKYGILMGGGIAFLLSIWGGATILFSAGNPEKTNEGREIITSAISGLMFIVLSVFLLRLIGVDILGLPDFKR